MDHAPVSTATTPAGTAASAAVMARMLTRLPALLLLPLRPLRRALPTTRTRAWRCEVCDYTTPDDGEALAHALIACHDVHWG